MLKLKLMMRSLLLLLLAITLVFSYYGLPEREVVAAKSEAEKLQAEIDDRNQDLKVLEDEINEYEKALQKVGAEKNTLSRSIRQLELERKKVLADLNLTKNKIGTTDLEISRLNLEITDIEGDIDLNRDALRDILRTISITDDDSLIENLLRYDNLAEFWTTIDDLELVKQAIRSEVTALKQLRDNLDGKVETNQTKRRDLVNLRNQYDSQQQVLHNNQTSKNKLLRETKNEEANYQKLLKQKQTAKEQILREIRNYESQLKFILDPTSIPTPGTPVFIWPLDKVVITQQFGGTEFAKQNASVYGGRPYHNGIDFGAPRGTKIKAPLSGTVRAIGNTDSVAGCYAWGKWSLIDHANGLSTLYAHQDVISVEPGDKVKTGEVIGYTGNTGYSTGPHLHFTVYATAAVKVRKFNEIKAITSCGRASTPFAAHSGYLDPINYLPPK